MFHDLSAFALIFTADGAETEIFYIITAIIVNKGGNFMQDDNQMYKRFLLMELMSNMNLSAPTLQLLNDIMQNTPEEQRDAKADELITLLQEKNEQEIIEILQKQA